MRLSVPTTLKFIKICENSTIATRIPPTIERNITPSPHRQPRPESSKYGSSLRINPSPDVSTPWRTFQTTKSGLCLSRTGPSVTHCHPAMALCPISKLRTGKPQVPPNRFRNDDESLGRATSADAKRLSAMASNLARTVPCTATVRFTQLARSLHLMES